MNTEAIKGLLSRKVGGVPVLFIVFGVSAVILYGAYRLKPNTATPATDTAPGDVTDAQGDQATNTDQPVFSATPTIIQPSGVNAGSVTSTPQADTDDLWKRRAVAYLIANGYTNDVATSAITKYLDNTALSSLEARARDTAVAQFGLPPESLPNGGTLPSAPSASAPFSKQGTPPCTHTVKGASDNTFPEIARGYYGFTGNTIAMLHAYNPGFGINSTFPVGTKIIVPKLVQPRYYRATAAKNTAYQIAAVNGTTPDKVINLNPAVHFPAKIGTSVRVR